MYWALVCDRRRIERLRMQEVKNWTLDSAFRQTSKVAHEVLYIMSAFICRMSLGGGIAIFKVQIVTVD